MMPRLCLRLAALIAIALQSGYSRADHSVVLVAREDCAITAIDPLDLRKIYLGFPVRDKLNSPLRAATNQSQRELYEIFLQDVMAMSARAYDRRLLTLTLQSGRRRPEIYQHVPELIRAVESDPGLITFMWEEDFDKAKGLKILRVIWKE